MFQHRFNHSSDRRLPLLLAASAAIAVAAAACTNVPMNSADDDSSVSAGSGSTASGGATSSSTASGTSTAGVGGAGGAASAQASAAVTSGTGGGMQNANCGDFLVQPGEDCDDGNMVAGDGCDNNCKTEAVVCGNSKVEAGEECDDGNMVLADGCDKSCKLEPGSTCGDAVDLNVALMNDSYSGDTTNKGNTNFGDPTCDTDLAAMSDTVVHRYTATATASYSFMTVSPMGGSMLDTVLWAYNDCLNAGAAAQIACNDDYDFQHYFSRIIRVLEKDETIFIVVAGSIYQGSSPAGPYTLIVKQNGSCGDGSVDLGEQCDDGNVAPADGCDPNCSLEVSMVEMESNGSVAMANAVSGSLIYATIDPSNDEDLYAISVKIDETVIAQLMPAFDNGCGEGTTMSLGDVDSELELLATDGVTPIAFQESSFCNYIATGVPSAGTYYVRVAASTTFCPGCRFGYRLLVKTETMAQPSGDPWINELHYDNVGGDQNEFVEVAGAAGTDLSGWLLVAYNGNGGGKYDTINLMGVIPDQQNGYGTLAFDFATLQNGAPDGVALIDGNNNNSIIDFISYEGAFVATDGEAQGAMSTDILVSESSATAVGDSLSLIGMGHQQASFKWSAMTAPHTKGMVNTTQTFQ